MVTGDSAEAGKRDRAQIRHLRALSRRISLGNCVLALGPGASIDLNEAQEIPLNVKLARELAADQRVSCTQDLNCDDLRHVSQVLFEMDRDLTLLQERVSDFYGGFTGKTTEFHKNIAALPFRLCITTTPDDFLYNAFDQAGKSPKRHFYNFKKSRTFQLPEPTVDQPLVYHLYGYPDEPESLVITENDLIDFLVSVIRDEPALPPSIRAKLSRQETTCMFVDLGFKNWYLRALLRALGFYGHAEMSVALEKPEFFAQSQQHQTTVYFSASKTIQFRQDSLNEFAEKLRETYDSLTEDGREKAPQLPEGAPRVFLSYAGEDRDEVEKLAEKLNGEGIGVWQDKQNLRAGDNWERVLIQVINKQVDYVMVVQTPTMVGQFEGYFYGEIAEALERKKNMKPGVLFLLPVQIGNVKILPQLESLHSHRVDTDDGFNALVSSIREDWEQRG